MYINVYYGSIATYWATCWNIISEDHGSSIRLDAMLNYRGDCHVDVTCTVGSLDPRRFGIGILIVKLHLLGFDEICIGILAGKFGLHEMELRQRQTKRNKMRHLYFYSQCSFRDQESCHPDWSIIDLGQELSPQGPCGSLAMILMVNLHGRRSIFRDGL